MSNVLNNLENNSHSSVNGCIAFNAASGDNPVPIPLDDSIQNDRPADVNLSSQSANSDKIALNDSRESVPVLEEMAQLQADLKLLSEVQMKQAAAMQALEAKSQTLSTSNRALQLQVSELQAKGEAHSKMLAEYRGGLQAIEMALRSFKLDQSARMNGFEQTYQTDKVQKGRQQQAKDQQTETHLRSLIDPMLAEAVEKAIRLLRLNGRPIPTPAKQPSTPSLDHLYINWVDKQRRTN